MSNFDMFAMIPELAKKFERVEIRLEIEKYSAAVNRSGSSANIKCVSLRALQFGLNLKRGFLVICFKVLERYSIMSINKRGKRGSPYLNPLTLIPSSI